MKRKLVRQGAATMMVSLPAKWLKEHKLEKGDEIEIEETDKGLLLTTKAGSGKSETTIKLINMTESSIRTLITNTYRAGFDRVKVVFDNEKQFNILSNVIKTRLIGFDVTKKEENTCVIENITEPSEEHFDTLIQKLFFNIGEMFDITEKRLKKSKEPYDYEEVAERTHRYDNWCRRVISKKMASIAKTDFLWAFMALLNHGQRELYHLNKAIDDRTDVSQKTMKLFSYAKESFELLKKAYFDKNIDVLARIHPLEKEAIYKEGYKLLETTHGRENIIVYHLMSCIRRLLCANSPLTGFLM
ncbi:MAG: AbrB/MazE/SpoVT family DNA-binding domain-containing protein [Candidatus Woesearchaeota archaeon]